MTSFRVHLRGLPWAATEDDVKKFFDDCVISSNEDAIHFLYNKNGRSSGEAYVEFDTAESYHKALLKNKQYMGARYIEVSAYNDTAHFDSFQRDGVVTSDDFDRNASAKDDENWNEPIVRLRGLPFSCTKDDIKYFFRGLQVAPDGITLASDFGGKRTGQAFVQFTNMDNANRALELHKKEIGHRYIEVFKSGLREAKNFIFGCLYDNYRSVMNPEQLNSTIDLLNNFSDQLMSAVKNPAMFNFDGQCDNFGKRKDMNDFSIPNKRSRMDSDNDFKYTSKTGYSIHMRGLPFESKVEDIHEFFKPYTLANVQLALGERNRFIGEADVDFYSYEDAQGAMKYDRRHIGKRYIELFLESKPKQEKKEVMPMFDSMASNKPSQDSLPKLLDIQTSQQAHSSSMQQANGSSNNNMQNFNSYFDAIKSLSQQQSTGFDAYSQQAAAAAAYAYSTNMQNYQQYYTQNYQAANNNSNPTSGYNSYPF